MKKVIVALVLVCGMALGTIWYVVAQTNGSSLGPYAPGDLWTAEDANTVVDQLRQFALFFEKIDALRRIFVFSLLAPVDGAVDAMANNAASHTLSGGFATLTRTDLGNAVVVVAKGLDPTLPTEVSYYHFNDTSACQHPITLATSIPLVDLNPTYALRCDPLADDSSVDGVCVTHNQDPHFLCQDEALVEANNLGNICDSLGLDDGSDGILKALLFLRLDGDCSLTNPLGEAHVIISQDGDPVWRAGFPEHEDLVLPEFSTHTSF